MDYCKSIYRPNRDLLELEIKIITENETEDSNSMKNFKNEYFSEFDYCLRELLILNCFELEDSYQKVTDKELTQIDFYKRINQNKEEKHVVVKTIVKDLNHINRMKPKGTTIWLNRIIHSSYSLTLEEVSQILEIYDPDF